jgi:hypothetical protein
MMRMLSFATRDILATALGAIAAVGPSCYTAVRYLCACISQGAGERLISLSQSAQIAMLAALASAVIALAVWSTPILHRWGAGGAVVLYGALVGTSCALFLPETGWDLSMFLAAGGGVVAGLGVRAALMRLIPAANLQS